MPAEDPDNGDPDAKVIMVDSTLCQGHGRCVATLPGRFDFDDLGYAVVLDPIVKSDDDDLARLRVAIDSCPERAISLGGRESH